MNGGREADSSPTSTVTLWGPLSLADGGGGGGSPSESACTRPRCQPPGRLPGHRSHQFSPAPEAGARAPDSRFSPSRRFSSHAGTQAQARGASTPARLVLTHRFSEEKGKRAWMRPGGRDRVLPAAPGWQESSAAALRVAPAEDPEASSPTGLHLILPCSSCTSNKGQMIKA